MLFILQLPTRFLRKNALMINFFALNACILADFVYLCTCNLQRVQDILLVSNRIATSKRIGANQYLRGHATMAWASP